MVGLQITPNRFYGRTFVLKRSAKKAAARHTELYASFGPANKREMMISPYRVERNREEII